MTQVRELIDAMLFHRVAQQTNALVQHANRYIDAQAPWALRKSDPERMETVLWVLMEVMRHVGVVSQPLTPTIAAHLLDQLGVPAEQRAFADLPTPSAQLQAGAPLPKPEIIVPRYEEPDAPPDAPDASAAQESAAAPATALSADELAALEEQIGAQGERVRAAKGGGASKESIDAEVAALLALKSQLPEGHPLLSGGAKKKKKKKAS